MPAARGTLDKACFYAACTASVWFGLVAFWGFVAPLGAGHYASMGGMGAAAENILRWHILGPIVGYMARPPTPADYYCHHPFGVFWDLVPLIFVFGHRDWVLWLPAVLMSTATPVLLYGIGKSAWGPIGGAAAAWGFVVVPIALGFANFHSLEVFTIFGCVLFFWGHARMLREGKQRYLWASAAGAVVAGSGDWPGYLAVGAMLAWGFVRAFVFPQAFAPVLARYRYARWWALSTAGILAVLVLWVALFAHAGKLAEWLGSASGRSGGAAQPLAAVLAGRKHWIELMFTPFVIFVGKLAAPVAVVRTLIRRRDEEVYSLAMLLTATVQYVAFPNGADIHIFWPHYFAAYYALAFAQLAVTVESAIGWSLRHIRAGALHRAASWTPLAFAIFPNLLVLPDGARVLRYARETGGRFNEHGWPTPLDTDMVLALHRLHEQSPPTSTMLVHPSTQWGWHHEWAWHIPISGASSSAPAHGGTGPPSYFLLRASWVSPEEQRHLAADYQVHAFGDVWVVDAHAPVAPLEASSFAEHEPKWLEWFWKGGWQPVRKITADPFWTCELRMHFNQPCDPIVADPTTLEEMRIAHNIAAARGEHDRAAELRARIEAGLDRTAAADFTEGVRLIGVRAIRGSEPRIETWFESAGPTHDGADWTVHSTLDAKKSFSFIPPDPVEREVSRPLWPSTSMWRPGFLYKHTALLWHRIGVERFTGFFTPRDGGKAVPTRADGETRTQLIVVR